MNFLHTWYRISPQVFFTNLPLAASRKVIYISSFWSLKNKLFLLLLLLLESFTFVQKRILLTSLYSLLPPPTGGIMTMAHSWLQLLDLSWYPSGQSICMWSLCLINCCSPGWIMTRAHSWLQLLDLSRYAREKPMFICHLWLTVGPLVELWELWHRPTLGIQVGI